MFPQVLPIRQPLLHPSLPDIPNAVRQAWTASRTWKRLRPGMRIGIACGSRGIAGFRTLVEATIHTLRTAGVEPFIIPAMGSHGGATAEGQAELLAGYGITEANLGVPVVSSMQTTQLGLNSWGEPVYWDRHALAADGIVTISRVKRHTDFRGRFESGILKMLVIGLGKREGASQHHRWGWKGLRDMMPESAKVILETTPFFGGLAVLENADEGTAHLEVVDRDDLFDREPELLTQSDAMMGRLPFDAADVLIVGEIGKNYSGSGMDPNVVGRLLIECAAELEPTRPRITRIVTLDLSPESHGNATGIGIADLCTERLLAAIDPIPFRMNNLTACCLWRSKLPIAFATDHACITAAIETCWQPIPERLKFAVIPNTLEVAEFYVSDALFETMELKASGPARELPFGADGNLRQEALFPHCVRAKRESA